MPNKWLILFEDFAVPARALIVALAGLALAQMWFNSHLILAVILSLIVISLGQLFEWFGESKLPDNPISGLFFMEFWILFPGMLSAVAAGLVVILSVSLAVPEGATTVNKELLTSLSTALTAFLTTGFIAWTEDTKRSKLSERIKRNFQRKYTRYKEGEKPKSGIHYFKADSRGERWIYSDIYGGIEGWGLTARWKRVGGIAQELKSGDSDP